MDLIKEWKDKGCKEVDFQVTENVLLKLGHEEFVPLKGVTRYLMWKYNDVFKTIKRVGKLAYIQEHIRVYHPVFHISELRKCWVDLGKLEQNSPTKDFAMIIDIQY